MQNTNTSQAFQKALHLHKAGQLQKAEKLYQSILQSTPKHPDANHNLGVIAMQQGKPEAGLQLLKTALEANPNNRQYWLSYIDALLRAGHIDAADNILRQGKDLGLNGHDVDKLEASLYGKEHSDGSGAPAADETSRVLELFNNHDLNEVRTAAMELTQRFPDHFFGWKALGMALMQLNLKQEALANLQQASLLSPADFDVRRCLGNLFLELGQLEQAILHFNAALQLQPDSFIVHNSLGIAHKQIGQHEQALQCYEKAIALNPQYSEAHSNLGVILNDLGRHASAIEHLEKALSIKPDFAEGWNNLGNAQRAAGMKEKAVASYEKALILNPELADTYNNLGNTLKDKGRFTEAIASYERAIQIKPDFAMAQSNLGLAYMDQGLVREAQFHYKKAVEAQPDSPQTHSHYLLSLNCISQPKDEQLKDHLKFNELQASRVKALPASHDHDINPDRKIRLGLVSADFRRHSVGFFITPLLEHIDQTRFEIFCYYNNTRNDPVTVALRNLSYKWAPCKGLSDHELAMKIRQDRIDILVDLSGHADGNRLMVFAAKPAPIQVTWIGYPNTTGLAAMDYRIVDEITDPEGEADKYCSEKLIRIKHGFLCYRPPVPVEDVPLEMAPFESKGHITFGSFNHIAKISPEAISMWGTILRNLPDSRLLLKSLSGISFNHWDRIKSTLVAQGAKPEQIEVRERMPSQKDHLNLYNQVDIALDTFPYHGTTTTCEALYMSVPVVTLMGDRHVCRVSGSILNRIGLPELVAKTEEEYVNIAVGLANDKDRLKHLRTSIRTLFQQSPLRDEQGHARAMENVFREMWRKWCVERTANDVLQKSIVHGNQRSSFSDDDIKNKNFTTLLSIYDSLDYFHPPLYSLNQTFCGPSCETKTDNNGHMVSLKTSVGKYNLSYVLPKLSLNKNIDVFIACVDSTMRNLPVGLNCSSFKKVLILGDTQHQYKPIQNVSDYALKNQYDIYLAENMKHHLHFFYKMMPKNKFYFFPGFRARFEAKTFLQNIDEVVTFVGQLGKFHPYRTKILQQLSKKNIPLKIIQKATQEQAAQIFARSLINLNISLNSNLCMHFFEVLGVGGFLLTERISKYTGYDLIFKEGRDFVFFDGPEDLCEKIDYYLKNPDKALEIAKNGFETYHKHWNIHKRRQMFFDLVMEDKIHPVLAAFQDERFPAGQAEDRDFLSDRIRLYEFVQEQHKFGPLDIYTTTGVPEKHRLDLLDLTRLNLISEYLEDHAHSPKLKPRVYITSDEEIIGAQLPSWFDKAKFEYVIITRVKDTVKPVEIENCEHLLKNIGFTATNPDYPYVFKASNTIDDVAKGIDINTPSSVKLDLGCGPRKYPGYIGVDKDKNWPGVDVEADLAKGIPYPDDSVDEIRAHNIIEHLPDRIHTMNEIWRVCKHGAVVDIVVPSTDGRGAFQDPTHVSFWNINSFKYYSVDHPQYLELCNSYGFIGKFKIIKLNQDGSPEENINVHALLETIK